MHSPENLLILIVPDEGYSRNMSCPFFRFQR